MQYKMYHFAKPTKYNLIENLCLIQLLNILIQNILKITSYVPDMRSITQLYKVK